MNMGLMQFTSATLGKAVSYRVILPHEFTAPHPVLLMLHGLSDDHDGWLVYSQIADFATKHHLLVVMPDGGRSFYLDVHHHLGDNLGTLNYQTFIMQDLREHVAKTFQIREGRWAIGGLSMGGFGALMLGTKFPEQFCSIWAHSGAFFTKTDLDKFHTGAKDSDIYAVTERFAKTSHPPVKIAFDCGTEDYLIAHNREMRDHLNNLAVPFTYEEHAGEHTWGYWNQRLPHALAFHAQALAEETT